MLVALAPLHEQGYIIDGGWPVEALADCFSNKGPWPVVGTTGTIMDFFEYLITFAGCDTFEERNCDAGFELVVLNNLAPSHSLLHSIVFFLRV